MCKLCDETYFFSQRQSIQLSKDFNIEGVVNDVINQLYNDRKIDKKTKGELIQSHYEPLKQAVNEGYNVKVEYGTPNYDFLQQLQTNAAVFAAFKAHAQGKEIAALLKDANGNLRSKEDFRTEALKVDATYRGRYLDAQYDMAVRQARAAVQWQKIQKQKRLYPNLKYMPSVSAHPREAHRAFYGIVRPVDDSFWNSHFPPISWGCKCRVEQVDEDVTDIPNNTPKLEPEFDFNAGKDAKVFDVEKSQYAQSVTPKEKPALIKEAAALVAIEQYKNAPYTTIYTSKSGTQILEHPLSKEAPDYTELMQGARKLANSNLPVEQIKILPYLKNDKDNVLRAKLMPEGVKGGHNPEYDIDGKITDLKTPRNNTYKSLEKLLEKCYEQCNNMYLDLDKADFNIGMVQNFFKGKFKVGYSKMETIIVNYKGDFKIFTREEILKGKWF